MADNNLTADKIKKLSDLVNIRRISDLETFQGNNSDTSFLNNSYLLTSSYINNKFVNYRLNIDSIIKYLNEQGNDDLTKLTYDFNSFISSIVQNTENSYIKFVSLSNELDEYLYTIEPKYSTINNGINPFSYIDGKSTYAYTNVLSDGIITNNVLEEYVRETLGRILGVPSTPAYISEAIDSVIEFVDWFKGYVRSDTSYGSLQNLINTIEAKDDEILNEAKSYTVENRELTYAYVESSYNKLYNGISTQLDNLETLTAGTNISIDTDKKINCDIGINATNNETITIGTSRYSLQFSNGEFFIKKETNPYQKITLTLNSPSQATLSAVEYGTGDTSINLSATPSKNCEILNGNNNTSYWGGVSGDVNAGIAIAANDVSMPNTSNFTAKLVVKEYLTQAESNYGGNSRDTASVTVSREIHYASWKFISATEYTSTNISDIAEFITSNNKQNINVNGWQTQYNFSDDSWGSGKYIYILIKKASGTFIIGSGTTAGQNPGGVSSVGTYKPYGTNSPTYYLYKSFQTSDCNIRVS